MKSGGNKRQSEQLEDLVRPYVPSDVAEDRVFEEWFKQAIAKYGASRRSSAFAPFNAWFGNQSYFPQNFTEFYRQRLEPHEIGQKTAKLIVVTAVSGYLRSSITDTAKTKHFVGAEEARVDPFIFDLFECLHGIDSESAFELAKTAADPRHGFASLLSDTGIPAIVELYYRFSTHDFVLDPDDPDTSVPDLWPNKADFSIALAEWCIEKFQASSLAALTSEIFSQVLPVALLSIRVANRGAPAGESQCNLLDRATALILEFEARRDHEIASHSSDDRAKERALERASSRASIAARLLRLCLDSTVDQYVRLLPAERKGGWPRSSLLVNIFADALAAGDANRAEEAETINLHISNPAPREIRTRSLFPDLVSDLTQRFESSVEVGGYQHAW